MINDHVYQSNYAGLDPAKQLCGHTYGPDSPICRLPRARHSRFISTETIDIINSSSGGDPGILDTNEFEWFDHSEVNLIESTFNDDTVCFAAWTSTKGDEADHTARKGLINRLMKDRHGSVYEHMMIQFQVTAPIFVWREHHRHRAGFSYNEESARYRTMRPRFYIPPRHRPMVKVEGTKAMDYVMEPIEEDSYDVVVDEFKTAATAEYHRYQGLLKAGIVREVARMCLPVNLMSTCIVTMNARALMNFLSLRVKDAAAAYPSNPQWEINQVALEYERHFERLAPMTYEAFITNGRVAP